MVKVDSRPPQYDTIPPGPAGRGHFTKAVSVLSECGAPPIHRTFGASAKIVRELSSQLIHALELGTPLEAIDELTTKLSSRLLAIQNETLRARKDGAR
jgi:hypothetical protein